jgi:hypothetical protein
VTTEESRLKLPPALLKIITSHKNFLKGRHEDVTELLDFIFDSLDFNAKALNGLWLTFSIFYFLFSF